MNKPSRAQISAYIICYNEQERIQQCLESVTWCDEIVVVDSGSTDETVNICKNFTGSIYHRDWTGYGDQKNFALTKCRHEWVLNIDADEIVSEELRSSIQRVLQDTSSAADGYLVQRVVYFLGRWWTAGGWYPEYRLRLGRKDEFEWSKDPVHERALTNGRKQKLKGSLYHYTYRNLEDQLNRLNKYSTLSAKQMFESSALFRRSPALCLLVRPIFRFIRFYFLKFGFIYGMAGFVVSITDSFYVFLKYAKLWELSLRLEERQKEDVPHAKTTHSTGNWRAKARRL